jgi:hypothetical protein
MLATNGPRWYDRRQPDSGWSSFAVSVALTAGLFASAFLAMRSVPAWITPSSADRETPVVVRLDPPAPLSKPRVEPAPPKTVTRTAPSPSQAAPTSPPTSILAPLPSVATPVAPNPARATTPASAAPTLGVPIGIVRDTMRGRGNQPVMGTRGGAPIAPLGLTIGDRVKNTPAFRDSVLQAARKGFVELAWKTPPKGEEKRALEASQRQGQQMMARRQTTVGNQNVHVMQGEAMGGEGAVGGRSGSGVSVGPGGVTVSVPFPLFSSGPSAAQRKQNEAIDLDYQYRLRRLNDRLFFVRDSIRADSLRRDSVAKARKPIQ